MEELSNIKVPSKLESINASTIEHGFDMASELETGSMLRFLCATKPGGRFLELGTGTGLATSWIVQAMDKESSLLSVDNDDSVLQIAKQHLGDDKRIEFISAEGIDVIRAQPTQSFDLIFADAWDGKYFHFNETVALLKNGGIYIVDDMLPRANWPEGHQEKVDNLIRTLEDRDDFYIVKMCWASGLIVGVKI